MCMSKDKRKKQKGIKMIKKIIGLLNNLAYYIGLCIMGLCVAIPVLYIIAGFIMALIQYNV